MRRVLVALVLSSVLLLVACGGGGSHPPVITVSISPSSAQTIDQGQTVALTASVANDSTTAGVTWSLTGGGALSSNTTTSVTYTAPASGASNISATVTATSVTDTTKSASLSITVTPPPAVTTTSLPNGTVGTAYSQTLAASGGAGALAWSISAGTLPAGLSLNASTGAITGTPTAIGVSNFTVKVTDHGSPALNATKALSITIVPAPLAITTSSLATGAAAEAYSATVAATGGTTPYAWSATGLPAGLAINAATGVISGTPAAASSSSVTVTVTDSTLPTAMSVNKPFSLTINAALAVVTNSLPNGTAGTAYSQSLAATGGLTPYAWSISLGTLPAGLTLNASTGAITGTPTTAGTSNFTVKVTDAGTGTATAALSITIAPAPLSITTTSPLATGAVNANYSATLQSAGGTPPVTWAVTTGSLPAGLALNAATGAITGIPTTAGTTTFTVTATDSTLPTAQTAAKQFSITVNPVLSITTTTLAAGSQGSAYSATVQATGGTTPYTWSITSGALPAGLTLNASTGQISGTPTTAGTSNFTIQAADASTPQQTATAALSITVNGATLVISSTTLPNGTVSTAYNTQLNLSGGTPPFTWSLLSGTLPAGLTLNTSTGAISGTPTATGTSSFTVKVVDSSVPQQSAQKALSITINAAGNNNAVLNGHYAFRVGGFSTTGYNAVVGSFVADGNGNITSVLFDSNDGTPVSGTGTGTYSVGADNRGTISITDNGGNHTTAAIAVGTISSGVATAGRLMDFDSTDWEAGEFLKQDTAAFSNAGINGNFAFGATGVDSASGNRFIFGGRLTNSNGTITGGNLDGDTQSSTSTPNLVTNATASGTYSIASNGRGTASLTVSGAVGTINQVIYVISASEYFIISADTGSVAYQGFALQQSSATFSNSALNGTSVFYSQSPQTGTSGTCGKIDVGIFTGNGTGSFSGSADENNCGTAATSTPSGTYSVSTNGRVTTVAGTRPPIFYLVSPGKGFFVGTSLSAEFGFFEPQTGGPFSASSIAGNFFFGTEDPTETNVSPEGGTVNIASTGSFTGTSDKNAQGTTSSGAVSGTFTVSSNGRATGTGGEIVYIISGSKLILIDNSSSNPKPIILQK